MRGGRLRCKACGSFIPRVSKLNLSDILAVIRELRAILPAQQDHDGLPPIQVIVAAGGRIVLRGEELGELVVEWRILSGTGDAIGAAELRSGFTMVFARGMQVWGIEYDELDVPYIVRYRITEAAEGD